ncbi:SPRY-domain-containing protein [Sparassis crispa]|uniref:SPRY-domain-containing protein n=1 Tax=Sparassis crispa TaxID=139825 RepID=A0A401G922_9APHY|nr:SPRY-domain-containing protein [Sparassis crispa]GBE78657.1 SPRY-domain-containing protein [Sparassis crispa]
MTTRPSRSASIPIPASSSAAARTLENVISMPFSNPTGSAPVPVRPRLTSTISRSPDNRRTVAASPVHTSPTRSIAGSYSSAVSLLGRGGTAARPGSNATSSTAPVPTFQPRIIRATSSPGSGPRDPACLPPLPASPSQPRPRRLSTIARTASTPAIARTHRQPLSSTLLPQSSSLLPPPAHSHTHTHTHAQANAFPRPAYLEYSSLRGFLHTESGPSLPPRHPPPASDRRTPSPPTVYPYLRRELTPVADSDRESTASPPPAASATTPSAAVGVLAANPVLRLPTRWSDQDRLPTLSVSADGRELTFSGPSCVGDRESAAARANYAIPPACGIYYYEVEILNKGNKGHISIGFASGEVRLSRLPGWEKHSWGYHADDGWAFPGQKDGSPYGPTFDSGDVIGCGVDFSQNRAFYTKNGNFLGNVFDNVGKGQELYPAVGLRHTGEAIRANFGGEPFRFAIADHVRAQRDAVWDGIMRTRIDWGALGLGGEVKAEGREDTEVLRLKGPDGLGGSTDEEEARVPMQQLVLAYLSHHGYARTARAFRAQCARTAEEVLRPPLLVKEEDNDARGLAKAEEQEELMDMDDDPLPTSAAYTLAPTVASAPAPSSSVEVDLSDPEAYDLQTRLAIVHAVLAGDIDNALAALRVYHSAALAAQDGLLLFRLRCQKFVELVLQAGDALKRVKEKEKDLEDGMAEDALDGTPAPEKDNEEMDIDDPAPTPSHAKPSDFPSPPPDTPAVLAKAALHTALSYGQELEADYKTDVRPGVRAHLRRTFGVVAYHEPARAGGAIGALAGQQARASLAAEVNQAILESQGRPAHPALETLFRQTSATITQLGLLGTGAAAFADVRREFLEA